jgi:type I restriction enzyme R subunit
MNLNNFIVRPRRRLVEKYAKPEAWTVLNEEDFGALAHDVAGLPSELVDEDEEAKRCDLLMPRLQLALLRIEPSFERWRDRAAPSPDCWRKSRASLWCASRCR